MDNKHLNFVLMMRYALGITVELPSSLSEAEWLAIYRTAQKQSVASVVFQGVKKLPSDLHPPLQILMTWAAEAERVAGKNRLLTEACRQLTQLFAGKGRRTAILKGQANARLYPEPLSRQPGDVDIWVEGGRDSVLHMLDDMALEYKIDYHHAHLHDLLYGANVEVHFLPSSGNYFPLTNWRLQKAVKEEIMKSEMTQEGFCVPTLRFALLMQMAHIQRHFLRTGIGLRHLTDYYLLLKNSSCPITTRELRRLGLRQIAGAVMWVLGDLFKLERERMICPPDRKRGEMMEREIFKGGNFGYYSDKKKGVWGQFLHYRKRHLELFSFCPTEVIWGEMMFWQRHHQKHSRKDKG